MNNASIIKASGFDKKAKLRGRISLEVNDSLTKPELPLADYRSGIPDLRCVQGFDFSERLILSVTETPYRCLSEPLKREFTVSQNIVYIEPLINNVVIMVGR